jgi:ABC-type transport system involved in cytochrome bd biosynthesis fused ATPase/permease subunit
MEAFLEPDVPKNPPSYYLPMMAREVFSVVRKHAWIPVAAITYVLGRVAAFYWSVDCIYLILNATSTSVNQAAASVMEAALIDLNNTSQSGDALFPEIAWKIVLYVALWFLCDPSLKLIDAIMIRISAPLSERLTLRLLHAYFHKSEAQAATVPPINVIHHFGNIHEYIAPTYTIAVAKLVASAVELIGLACFIGLVSTPVLGIYLAMLAACFIVGIPVAHRCIGLAFEYFIRRLGASYHYFGAHLASYDIAIIYDQIEKEMTDAAGWARQLTKKTTARRGIDAVAANVIRVPQALGLMGVLLYAVYLQLQQDKLEGGDFLLLFLYQFQGNYCINNFFAAYNKIVANYPNFRRLLDYIDEVPSGLPDASRRTIQVNNEHVGVEFDGVCFSHPGGTFVLENVNFRVIPGQMYAIVGESGGGKSTLIKLMLDRFALSAGRVLIGGEVAATLGLQEIVKHVAILLQASTIRTDTILENIRYARPAATDEEVVQAAHAAGLSKLVEEGRMGQSAGVGGRLLSGGEQRRVAIARVLLLRDQASVFVFDEPDTGLNAKVVQTIFNLIHELKNLGKAVIVITHTPVEMLPFKFDGVVQIEDFHPRPTNESEEDEFPPLDVEPLNPSSRAVSDLRKQQEAERNERSGGGPEMPVTLQLATASAHEDSGKESSDDSLAGGGGAGLTRRQPPRFPRFFFSGAGGGDESSSPDPDRSSPQVTDALLASDDSRRPASLRTTDNLLRKTTPRRKKKSRGKRPSSC